MSRAWRSTIERLADFSIALAEQWRRVRARWQRLSLRMQQRERQLLDGLPLPQRLMCNAWRLPHPLLRRGLVGGLQSKVVISAFLSLCLIVMIHAPVLLPVVMGTTFIAPPPATPAFLASLTWSPSFTASATDNGPSISGAITTAANLGGGLVLIPEAPASGSFAGYNQIVMKSNVWLKGLGPNSKLFSINSNPNTYSVVLADATQTDCWITDIEFHGNKTNQTTNGWLNFDQTGQSGDRRHRIERARIRFFKNDGLHFTGAARACWIKDLYIINCDGNSYTFETNATDSLISGCVSGLAGLNGFVNQAANNRYASCKSFQSGQVDAVSNGDGYQFKAGNVCEVANCESQSCLRHGYFYQGANFHNTIGLTADSNSGDAIRLDNTLTSMIQATVTFSAGTGVGHTSIVNFLNGSTNNIIQVIYQATSLKSGNLAVQGTIGAGNDVLCEAIATAWSRERNWRLNALGAIAESMPLDSASSNGLPATQELVCCAFYFFAGQTITGISVPVLAGAAGLTLAQSAIYAQSNSALLANSADQSGTLNGAGAGRFQMAFTAPFQITVSGLYYVGFLFVGTTPPSIARSNAAGPQNLVARAGQPHRYVHQTGQATLPAPATFAAPVTGNGYAFEVY